MTLKPVYFKKDIQHTNLTVQAIRSSAPRAPLRKPVKISFSDSDYDDGFDNPIPFLKKSSSSESFSDEDHDIDIKPTQIRKGFRRPIPMNRGAPKPPNQQNSNTDIQKEPTTTVTNKKFLPHPPNSTKSHVSPPNENKDKKVSPMFFRRMKKKDAPEENANNWATPQKQASLVKPKIKKDASFSYSDDEQSYNTSNNDSDEDFTPTENQSNFKQSPSSNAENGNTSNPEIDSTNINPDPDNTDTNNIDKDNTEIKQILNDQINNILNSNTTNDQGNDQAPPSPVHTDEHQITEESEGPPQSVCYYMDRKIVSKFTKNKLSMSLTKGSYALITQSFDIRDESFQITHENQRYTILMESSQCSFSLRRGESYGDEIFSILYNTTKNAIRPKNCVLRFFIKVQGLPNRLQSVQPETNAEGEPQISFDHRQVIPSVKNMKFLDENKKEILAVMKIGKDQICIEAAPSFPEVIIFIIGVAAFLNHSK